MNFSFKPWPHGVVALGAVGLTYMFLRRAAPIGGRYRSPSPALKLVTWNVAAINNNPFEYWITHSDKNYNSLMQGVQTFVDSPGEMDVPVANVFTQTMFDELKENMNKLGWPGVEKVEAAWETDYKKRKIISGFIKDSKIGKKRLASMPDRITNTISSAEGKEAYRPTVINCYEGDLSTSDLWWGQWKEFMFEQKFSVVGKGGSISSKTPSGMLTKIQHSKYPDISLEEEEISIPLQTLCCAIFDAIMVHMMNKVSPSWQGLRSEMCNALNKNKVPRTMQILDQVYGDADVIFLQEVSGAMAEEAKRVLGDRFDVHLPADMDSVRDQNSLILTSKKTFCLSGIHEVNVPFDASQPSPVAKGDLFTLTAIDSNGVKYLLASFHGDTNGLASIPVVKATHGLLQSAYPDHNLLFGLDANTYADDSKGTQNLFEFVDVCTSLGLTSNWGEKPDKSKITTFNARTFLQPQLNKAVKYNEKDIKGDRNLKDFILFPKGDFSVASYKRDNTGSGAFIENMVIPSLTFPSDHCILEVRLNPTLNSSI